MGARELESFLSSLATEGGVAASTQNQALAALLFLYREVLDLDVPWVSDVVRAKRPVRLPTVLTRNEVGLVLSSLSGTTHLVGLLLYGAGLRLLECLRLRVKDVDTTMIYTHVLNRGPAGVRSPADLLTNASVHETTDTAWLLDKPGGGARSRTGFGK